MVKDLLKGAAASSLEYQGITFSREKDGRLFEALPGTWKVLRYDASTTSSSKWGEGKATLCQVANQDTGEQIECFVKHSGAVPKGILKATLYAIPAEGRVGVSFREASWTEVGE